MWDQKWAGIIDAASEKLTPYLRLPHCPLSKADRSMPTAHFPGVLNRLRNNLATVSNVRVVLQREWGTTHHETIVTSKSNRSPSAQRDACPRKGTPSRRRRSLWCQILYVDVHVSFENFLEHVMRTEFLPWENPMTTIRELQMATECTCIISCNSVAPEDIYSIRCRPNTNTSNQASDRCVRHSINRRTTNRIYFCVRARNFRSQARVWHRVCEWTHAWGFSRAHHSYRPSYARPSLKKRLLQ